MKKLMIRLINLICFKLKTKLSKSKKAKVTYTQEYRLTSEWRIFKTILRTNLKLFLQAHHSKRASLSTIIKYQQVRKSQN
jgi:hypothetical protein